MASAFRRYWRRRDVCSKPSVIACQPMSLNDLPDEILLKILSHFGPEDLRLISAKVCERWNVLANDMVLWKTLCYICDSSNDISRIAQVRCIALLGFRTNYLTNFPPSSVSKVRNPKEHFRNYTSFHPEVKQIS
jgi:hypothetical protein